MPPNGSPPPARKRSSSGADSPPAGERPAGARPPPLPRASPEQKLVCTSGPRAGEEFVLNQAEVIIGRAADATVSIPDTSVSRRHVMLRRAPNGWLAKDLGSGNGTLVNGEPIADETLLRNGDVVTCGDSELSFLDPSNVTDKRMVPATRPPTAPELPVRRPGGRVEGRPRVARPHLKAPDPAAQRRKRRMVAYLFIFLAMCGATFGVVKLQSRAKEQKQADVDRKAQERRMDLSRIFQEAKNLVRAGKWSEAKGRFEKIKGMEPNYPGVADYLQRAATEVPNEANLDAAEGALNANQIAAAAEALGKVSGDTQQFERLRLLKSTLEDKVTSRLADARDLMIVAPKASSAEDTSKYDQVVEITKDVLLAYPDNRDAKVMNEQARQEIAVLTAPKPERRVAAPKPWEAAINLFVDGDVPGAFSVATACSDKGVARCKAMLGEMNDFKSYYAKLEDLDARGLTTLLQLDEKITEGRGPSKMARNAGTRAATIFYKSATAAKASGQWGKAMEYALKALKADPGHAGAQAVIAELRQKAKEIYLLGYSLKDSSPDEAMTKFKEVVQMTPPDDDTHQKAKRRLEELK